MAESGSGRVLVFTARSLRHLPARPMVFTRGLDRPFGIAFYPTSRPRYVYVAAANQVVRYPYRTGDRTARGPAEVIIADIPTERHWTRDLAVAPDGRHLFVSIGSASNVAGGMRKRRRRRSGPGKPPTGATQPGARRRTGPWYASSTRTARPCATTRPVCATLGHDRAARHQLPVVHAMQMVFYNNNAFPRQYRGDAFATLRGSWNREDRTGYKVVRAIMVNGRPTGVYEDFMTGFVLDEQRVWGRPTGIVVTHDGAVLVSDDANGTIFRIAPERSKHRPTNKDRG